MQMDSSQTRLIVKQARYDSVNALPPEAAASLYEGAMNSLASEIALLEERAAALSLQLSPVLLDAEPKCESDIGIGAVSAVMPRSPLTDWLADHTSRLRQLNNSIAAIQGRLVL